jgi:hypothetical protein
MAWEAIMEEWQGTLTREAIADAVHLSQASGF